MLLQVVIFHSVLWSSHTPLYICISAFLYTHLLMGTWVASIILAIVNDAAMNIGVHVFFRISVLGFFDKYPEME